MPTRLRKIRKQRGSRSMGWGPVGQHRSAGMRGGRGKAGLMKHKWTWTVKYDPHHFGKRGFTPPNRVRPGNWVNVGQIDEIHRSDGGAAPGSAKKKVGLNLTEMGYRKLLGAGTVKGSYSIVVASTTKLAKKKVEDSGGEISTG